VALSCSGSLINERKVESGKGRNVEDEIERSKVHWSQLTEYDNDNNEVVEVSNEEVFKSLQRHPTWVTSSALLVMVEFMMLVT